MDAACDPTGAHAPAAERALRRGGVVLGALRADRVSHEGRAGGDVHGREVHGAAQPVQAALHQQAGLGVLGVRRADADHAVVLRSGG